MAYTIKAGDTLSEIAAANNTTVAALKAANNISNVNNIQAGASLNITGGNNNTTVNNTSDKNTVNNTSDKNTVNKTSGSYTIQAGDTLSEIAVKYGTTVDALKAANNITDANTIQAGASLNITGDDTSSNTVAGTGDDTTSTNTWWEDVGNFWLDDDGAEYVNGVLVYDGTMFGKTAGTPVEKANGGWGDDGKGGYLYSGWANSTSNDADYAKGEYKERYTWQNGIKTLITPIAMLPNLVGGIFEWALDLDPATQGQADGSMLNAWTGEPESIKVYKNEDGLYYTYNMFNMPYEITRQADGTYVDTLKLPVDANGNILTTEQIEGGTAAAFESGYAYSKAQSDALGSNDTTSELNALEKANDGTKPDESSSADDGTATDQTAVEALLAWSKAAGLDVQETDLEAMVADPAAWAESRNLKLEDLIPTLNADAEGTTLDPNDPNYSIGAVDGANIDVTTVADNSVSTISGVTAADPVTYTASLNSDKLDDSFNVNAVTGEINENNLVDASTIETDIEAAASGTSAVGKAINDYATQDFSTIIDTSTVSGKNLAKALGEGNYVDQKATITGQMEIISAQFVNEQGQSVIPKWAQKIARSVSQTIAFDGITGSAQTSAMATAIMEATLGVAEKEATFFQTLTTKNLDNRQQAIINKANVLAKFEVANLGARQAAAVQNAQAFLEMDLKNLTNEQQAEVINKQAKTQALFEDSKIINAQRLFTAETENEYKKFYDELNVAIQKHNSTELNSMKKFNAGEINDNSEFNATLEDSRQKFYSNLQYNIDTSNAKWRQEVTVKQFQAEVDAIAADVKNALDLSTEAMSQLWDRADSLLDFIFKKDNGDANRLVTLLGSQLSAEAQTSGGTNWLDAVLGIGGAVAGTKAGTDAIVSGVKTLWNWATSDIRLKKNIKLLENRNGINIYKWEWTDKALRMGVDTSYTAGVIAQDLQKTHPEAISKDASGYLMVNYEVVQHAIQ